MKSIKINTVVVPASTSLVSTTSNAALTTCPQFADTECWPIDNSGTVNGAWKCPVASAVVVATACPSIDSVTVAPAAQPAPRATLVLPTLTVR